MGREEGGGEGEGEGEGGEIWENGIETCIISCMKRVASPGSMHDTGCLGLVHWDDPEGGYGEGAYISQPGPAGREDYSEIVLLGSTSEVVSISETPLLERIGPRSLCPGLGLGWDRNKGGNACDCPLLCPALASCLGKPSWL